MFAASSLHDCTNPALAPRAARLGLEEAWGEGIEGRIAALAFALARAGEGDPRPTVLAAPRPWVREHGLWFRDGLTGLGLDPRSLLIIETQKEAQVLWALEEALRSRAVAGTVAALMSFGGRVRSSRQGADASRAARSSRRLASRVRPSTAALTRSRGEPPGEWLLEWDDEAHRFRLAAGLADHGLVPRGRAVSAA
ncbi:hypothetical protein GVN21_18815 [Caulobacter sp. SLTY]|uniref:hypothetical protein n=1 Tax=Caulobacter sp. SLTY TaxID=2683262 RepID=UPI0014131266|nr:hypothetical protein [Caulobacter sp. SLTY]NBB17419.1 hypothetical protein [Caulobacter sp. SLTY]